MCADAAFVGEPREALHGVEVGRVLEGPPVELQEVDARHAQALERAHDAGAHDLGRHRAGRWAPLREGADRRLRGLGGLGFGRVQQVPGDDLGRAVVVGHVEGVEAGRRVGGHVGAGEGGVERRAAALLVGHLPQARDDARDLEAGGEFDARGLLVGHGAGLAACVEAPATAQPNGMRNNARKSVTPSLVIALNKPGQKVAASRAPTKITA